MPGYRVHVGTAVIFYCAALITLSSWFLLKPTLKIAVGWFLCTILGALFPDIDTKSKGQILFYKIISIVLLLCLYKHMFAAFIWTALMAMVPLLVNHRGIFHNSYFVIFVSFSFSFFLSAWYPHHETRLFFYALFFSLGALSHIFLDRFVSRVKRMRY